MNGPEDQSGDVVADIVAAAAPPVFDVVPTPGLVVRDHRWDLVTAWVGWDPWIGARRVTVQILTRDHVILEQTIVFRPIDSTGSSDPYAFGYTLDGIVRNLDERLRIIGDPRW